MDNVRGKILIEARKESSSSKAREQKLHTDDVLLPRTRYSTSNWLKQLMRGTSQFWARHNGISALVSRGNQ